MNPLECIEDGISRGDWGIVCDGYEKLTGKSVSSPIINTRICSAENALKQIIDIASTTINGPTAEICAQPEKPAKKKRGRPRKNNTSTTSNEDDDTVTQKIGVIQLITNYPSPEEVEMNKKKAKRANGNKAKLDRRAQQSYNVKCNECENQFKSDRPSGEMGQKCPKCLQDKKSRRG